MSIEIPYKYQPYKSQLPIWDFFMNGGRYAAVMAHRRFGKDLLAINMIATKMMARPGNYWHALPSREQATKAVWEGQRKDGLKYLSHFPDELIEHRYETQKMIKFKNNSIYRLVGADSDSLVGAGPIGVVLSEFSLMGASTWQYLSPMLNENGGWCLMIFTPRGKNHAVKLWETWKKASETDPNYMAMKLTIEDTQADTGWDIDELLRRERLNGMSEEKIQSEYYCDSDAPIEGSYYSEVLNKIEGDGHITNVPWESNLEVHTAWDLGINDNTAIWFYQQYGSEIRVIDHYENKNKDLMHYVKLVKDKPYIYGRHFGPHDLAVREFSGGGKTRFDRAREMGIKFTILSRISKDEGIENARATLYRCYFDKNKCAHGLDCLRAYHRQWDDMAGTFIDHDVHDWASDTADAFRYMCQSIRKFRDPNERNKRQTRVKTAFELLR